MARRRPFPITIRPRRSVPTLAEGLLMFFEVIAECDRIAARRLMHKRHSSQTKRKVQH